MMTPVAGFEPATTRLTGEVTLVFTTGRTSRNSSLRAFNSQGTWNTVEGSNPGLFPSRRAAKLPRTSPLAELTNLPTELTYSMASNRRFC